MHVSNTGVLVLLLIIIISCSVLAAHFGVGIGEVQGVDHPVQPQSSGLLSAITFGWDSLQAYAALISFTVPGLPYIFSLIFLLMNLLMGWIVISLIRGTSS